MTLMIVRATLITIMMVMATLMTLMMVMTTLMPMMMVMARDAEMCLEGRSLGSRPPLIPSAQGHFMSMLIMVATLVTMFAI